MNINNLFEIVKSRHSVRSYLEKPIPENIVASLQSVINECNSEGNLHIQLVTDEPNAFGKSFFAHYGKFSNVRNYICMVADSRSEPEQRIGYYGEKIVIHAQGLGLNTCWVGLSYSKGNTKCVVEKGEKIYCLIALGYGETQGVQSKMKTANQICAKYDEMPDWFKRGVDFSLYAPSAINQRKYRFALVGDEGVKASSAWGPYSKVDLGIARYHFELGANRPVKWV